MLTIEKLKQSLSLPVIAAPMFIVSNPKLLLAQCRGGIVGSLPALNARPPELFEEWLSHINRELEKSRQENPQQKIAPYAVNIIVHKTNQRLEHDIALCEKYRVPIVITSLGKPTEIVKRVHDWGGLVFHDVISVKHALKAAEAGVDGLIAVTTGAGGHAGTLNPFALVPELKKAFDGPVALSGALSKGEHVLAALSKGADFAYMGTRFIATDEANASQDYKDMLISSSAKDIVYTPVFTGVLGNYLRGSIEKEGLDPDNLDSDSAATPDFNGHSKAWKDIWGAGQGVGSIDSILPTAKVIENLKREFEQARSRFSQMGQQ